jgi:hypothetical protein
MKDLNISYVFDWKNSPNTSAAVKVQDQIGVWRSLGAKVNPLIVSPIQFKNQWQIPAANIYYYKGKIGRFKARMHLVKVLSKNKSIVYRRYGIFTPFELIQLTRSKTVLEFNTNNDYFYMNRSLILYFWHRFQLQIIGNSLLGGCAVTSEIKNLQKAKIAEKTEVFTNSIDFDQIKFRKKITKQKRMRLVFLAGETNTWNGVSKIYLIARNLKSVDFFIIGVPKPKNYPSNIFWLDSMQGVELQKKISTMSIGISTLNLASVGLIEGAPLKSRFYLALGLPIISSAPDYALRNLPGHVFKIEFNAESTEIVNLDELIEFIKVSAERVVPVKSLKNISAKHIESLRLVFIEKLINSK